ncbi:MAG: PAS domain S-box protein [Methylophilaceae bacterium]|nr:PAS domain S-box protein [Methylophilaceae bacterium]
MTGWLSGEAKGRQLAQVFNIINEETRKPTENPVANCLKNGRVTSQTKQTIWISCNGSEFGIEDSAAPIRNQLGEILGVVLVFHDVTELPRLNSKVSYRAMHDALPGLINRSEFESFTTRAKHGASKIHYTYIDVY